MAALERVGMADRFGHRPSGHLGGPADVSNEMILKRFADKMPNTNLWHFAFRTFGWGLPPAVTTADMFSPL